MEILCLFSRPDVLGSLIRIKDFGSTFLPDALRKIFIELPTPEKDALNFIARVVERFSDHFAACNPHTGWPSGMFLAFAHMEGFCAYWL